MSAPKAGLLLLALLGACDDSITAGGAGTDAGAEDDPLVFTDDPDEGTLDHIHRTIIQPSCAGQPGLCHSGQFEPNMATPASFYAALVNRPGLEHPDQLRVRPGAADDSLLVDKLRGRDVGTRMPLGAEPLTEVQIAEIEAWIESGALRAPGAEDPELLNELPYEPEVGIFDEAGARLDGAGPGAVSVGDTLTLRQSVRDFETADANIPASLFVIVAADGRNVVVNPAANDPQIAVGAFDASGPVGLGDTLNWKYEWTVTATVSLRDDDTGVITPGVSTAGMTFSVIAVYVDGFAADSMSAIGFAVNAVQVQP